MYRGSHIIGSLRPREVQAQPCVWDKHLMIPHNLTSHLKRVYNSFLPNKIVFHDICRIRFHKIPLMTIYNHPNLEHGIIPSEAIITVRIPNTLTLTNHLRVPNGAGAGINFHTSTKNKRWPKTWNHTISPSWMFRRAKRPHPWIPDLPKHTRSFSVRWTRRQLTKKKW